MKWIEPATISIPSELTAEVGGHPLVSRALVERAFHHPIYEFQNHSELKVNEEVQRALAYLDPSLYKPSLFGELPGLEVAVKRLSEAIRENERILVWGDFDVDGQTSTALLASALRSLGASVDTYIPDRTRESHGINLPKFQQYLKQGYRVVLTCDTGISAHEPVDQANQQQVDVIITDHHDLPPTLPAALAVVNPRLLPANHSMSHLPGVGVAYELISGLLHQFGQDQEKVKYLDLVALGIIADLAILKGDVRYLLQLGLSALRSSKRPGLLAMMERIEIDPAGITEDHVGFLLAPRLNALGRLADANLGVELLLTQDLSKARIMALQLEGLNTRRRYLTNSVFQGALAQIRANPDILEQPVILLDNPSWPSGVIGIVASRLVERYGKPVMLITAGEDGIGRGSARSVEGINISNVLSQVREHLLAFGGHPMAAGFSLPLAAIPEFRQAIRRRVSTALNPMTVMQIDGYLPLSSLDLGLVQDLERLAPFGPGNPPLTLVCQNLRMKSHAAMGREEEHLSIRVVEEETGADLRVVWWQGAGWSLPDGVFDLAYHVRSQNIRGETDILVEWVDFRSAGNETAVVRLSDIKPIFFDYRNEPHPLVMLDLLFSKGEYQIWAEGEAVKKLVTMNISSNKRNDFQPAENLIIWTIPPGPLEFQEVLKLCVPKRIYIFSQNPESDDPNYFITRLSSYVKFAIKNNQGKVSLHTLAASTAQRIPCVQRGLDWLVSQGLITTEYENNQILTISPGPGSQHSPSNKQAWDQVVKTLAETAAFRTYYLKADIQFIRSLAEKGTDKRKNEAM